MYFQTCKNSSSAFKRKADVFGCFMFHFETVFNYDLSITMIYFFMFLRKLISSSEFDDTTLTILEKECLIEDRSILYLYCLFHVFHVFRYKS